MSPGEAGVETDKPVWGWVMETDDPCVVPVRPMSLCGAG